ncbi:unnamed protein product [Allacma fusca]|uniref:Uncharacterized protein n=1 Tax=Allacma fusca TaxID=39272 RepID=A0A8J2L5D7_9HEXA|nr:unnamed protein product [Allacma fusca]
MMAKTRPPLIHVSRDRKIKVSVRPSIDAREALDDLQCPSRAEQAIQPATNEVITYRRGKV